MNTKLSETWKKVKLTEITEIIRGVSYNGNDVKNEPQVDHIPIMRAGNINQSIIYEDYVYIPRKYVTKEQLLQKGDILIATSSGSKDIVGKSAQIDKDNKDISFGAFCCVVRPKNINSKYLKFYFKSKHYKSFVGKTIRGVNINNLRISEIRNLMIPVPPPNIQNNIALTLEKAEKVKEMRKEADELTNEFVKATFLGMFRKIIFNKKTPTFPLKNILEKIDSGTSPVCEQYPRNNPNQTAVLKLSSVTYGFFNPDENKVLPSRTEIKRRVSVKKDDLLFSRKNTYSLVGATAYVFESDENLLLPDIIFKLVYDKNKINGIFLWKLLSEPSFKKRVENLASGSTGSMPNISKERLMKLEIPIPHMDLQTKFAELVQNIEYIKKYQKSTQKLLENMFNVLIQKAFKGELIC